MKSYFKAKNTFVMGVTFKYTQGFSFLSKNFMRTFSFYKSFFIKIQ